MKRVEFMEWNAVKEKAISGKLLAIGQDESKKAGGDDGTIMMYMGEEDPEAAQGKFSSLLFYRAGNTSANGPRKE